MHLIPNSSYPPRLLHGSGEHSVYTDSQRSERERDTFRFISNDGIRARFTVERKIMLREFIKESRRNSASLNAHLRPVTLPSKSERDDFFKYTGRIGSPQFRKYAK